MTIDGVLKNLGLENYVSVSPRLEERGLRAGHLLLMLRSVSGARTLLLKERKGYLSPEEFRLHIDLHRHLLERGGPVVEIPASLAGRLPLELPDGRLFEVQAWGWGEPGSESPEDRSRMGELLARFHRAAEDFPWPADPGVHQEPRERFPKANFYRPYLDSALEGTGEEAVAELYAHLATAERAVREREAAEGPLPRQALHGDPAPSNVLLWGERGGCLIDLDDAHRGPPCADLAWLLCLTAGLQEVRDSVSGWRVRERWDEAGIAAILRGYRSAGGPSAALGPRWLKPWLVASMVCAVGDCFLGGPYPVDGREVFHRQLRRALERINEIPALQLEISGRTKDR